MRVFNMATEAVKQGGTRRGANMGILRVDHPDILEFIDCKKVNGDITNFNISVGITEAFMQAVEENRDYDLIDPQTRRPVGKRSARELFEKIVEINRTGVPILMVEQNARLALREKNGCPLSMELTYMNTSYDYGEANGHWRRIPFVTLMFEYVDEAGAHWNADAFINGVTSQTTGTHVYSYDAE